MQLYFAGLITIQIKVLQSFLSNRSVCVCFCKEIYAAYNLVGPCIVLIVLGIFNRSWRC